VSAQSFSKFYVLTLFYYSYDEFRDKSIMPLEVMMSFGENILNEFLSIIGSGRMHPHRKQISAAIASWTKVDVDRPDFRKLFNC
jgi:hypothetical protein